ncbi:MAG TPA: roadblock/LC7 domain-containing protein [Candidatus Eisenbacteria bacterium]|jgi:predicted regulator of Ras-like GTPase activity (Roadblock/LC7/MglB family)
MPQWTLFESDFKLIDDVLDELLQRTNALSAHLIDRSGQVITSAGRVDDFDVTSFASLAAADFTANTELAMLLGEASVDAVVNEGRARSVYSRLLADRVILSVVFDKRSTLGLVRIRSRRGAETLDNVFRTLFEKVGIGGEAPAEAFEAAPDFAAAASNEVDALFGE